MRRVILLGASNLTLGLPCILDELLSGFEEPVEVVAALGHGRSYGIWSSFLWRQLPGIIDCGLWTAIRLAEPSPDRTLAVITDVGNDLLYGVEVLQIVNWVETCLERLAEQNAMVGVTLLPMQSVRRLSSWRYHLAKTLLFPGHKRIGWPKMRGRINDLNEQLRALATRYQARLFEPPGRWYGVDPIHIRRRDRPEAWREILSLCAPEETTFRRCRPTMRFCCRCWTARPAEWRLCGRSRTTPQPVLSTDRLRLSLY